MMSLDMLLDGAALLLVLGFLVMSMLFALIVNEAILEYREYRKSGKPLTKWGNHE